MPAVLQFTLTWMFPFAFSLYTRAICYPLHFMPIELYSLFDRWFTFSFSLIFQVDNSTIFHISKFNIDDAIA